MTSETRSLFAGMPFFMNGFLEQAIQAGPAQVMSAVGVVTLGAASFVNPPAAGLLCVQSQLSIGFARLRVAATQNSHHDHDNYS